MEREDGQKEENKTRLSRFPEVDYLRLKQDLSIEKHLEVGLGVEKTGNYWLRGIELEIYMYKELYEEEKSHH